jgi:ABC-2 type transport system permease protein
LILHVARTAWMALRRDRGALVLSFVLPIAFFSIFAVIFGRQHDSTPKVHVIVVDEDRSEASRDLVKGLEDESSLVVATKPEASKNAPPPADYTAATAEAAVKAGDVPVALIIPSGFGQHPMAFGPEAAGSSIQLLNDESDPIAPQIVVGMLQKTAMTSMPAVMASEGMNTAEKYIGGFTPEQKKVVDSGLADLRKEVAEGKVGRASGGSASGTKNGSDGFSAGLVHVEQRAVVGQNKKSPMISFYAAGIGVMFLLFTASNSAGALLDEAESGTLDRVLSTHVTMTRLLAGKLVFNTTLAFVQLTAMFLWGWAVFKLDFFSHLPGFAVMGIVTAFAVAAFGMLLASACKTRAQLGALSTLLILTMSAVGGSMFPRFLMPESMQKAGLLTINGWAIDGFTKVFWRDLPVKELWPQATVLVAIGVVLFVVARKIAQRWETA